MDPDLRLIVNEIVPMDLRIALETDAREQNISMNDAAVKILSEKYRTRRQAPRSEYRASAPRLRLKVPEGLHRKLHLEAARRHATVRGLALSTLAEHYGTTYIDPRRKPRRTSNG